MKRPSGEMPGPSSMKLTEDGQDTGAIPVASTN